MRIAALLVGLSVCGVLLFADDHSVDFDHHTDFSALKTFAFHEAKVNSPRPELNNPLVARKIGDAIRMELLSKGLKETANNPDLLVDYGITGEEYAEQRGGPAAFNRGILVIDLIKRESKTLVWRAVYRDDERTAGKVAQNLPADVKKSFSEYPPRLKTPVEPGPATPVTLRDTTPKGVAASALAIVQSARQDKSYVGPGAHPGLDVSFNTLERAARTVAEDDGESPAASENRIKALHKAIQNAAEFADSLATRTSETPGARAKSRDLAEKLHSLIAP